MDISYQKLIEAALAARELAYAPYSHYQVGAAILTQSGQIFTGCNVENASFGATICAERTALAKAVSEGEREFAAIAIVGGAQGESPTGLAYPCGICRQVLSELCAPDMPVVIARSVEEFETYSLAQLLPQAFVGNNIK